MSKTAEKPSLDMHGTTHFWSESETAAYVEWINTQLKDDPELSTKLPLSKTGTALFEACKDGILLTKLINRSVPNTIDEKLLNKKPKSPIHISENLVKVLAGAKQIGCQVHNLGPEDIKSAIPHLCLGLIWQVIKARAFIGLLSRVIHMRNGEDSSPSSQRASIAIDSTSFKSHTSNSTAQHEKVLLGWLNQNLEKSGCARKVTNFGNDLADSICLSFLIHHISPVGLKAEFDLDKCIAEKDLTRRAELMLDAAEKMGCRQFASPADIIAGNKNLNMAFVAVLYNAQSERIAAEKRSALQADSEDKLRKEAREKDVIIQNLASNSEANIAQLRAQISELKKQIEQMQSSLETAQKESIDLHQAAEHKDIMIRDLNLQQVHTLALIEELRSQIAIAERKISESASKEIQLNEAIIQKELINSLGSKQSNAESNTSALLGKIESLEAQLEKLQTELTRAKKDAQDLQHNLVEKEEIIKDLTAKKTAFNAKIDDLKNQIQQNANKTQMEISAIKNNAIEWEQKAREKTELVNQLDSQVQENNEAISQLRREKEYALSETVKLNSQIKILQKAAEQAEMDLKRTSGSQELALTTLRDANTAAEILAAQLKSQNSNLIADLHSLRRELEAATKGAQLSEISYKNEIRGMQEMLKQKNAEISQLTQQTQLLISNSNSKEASLKTELKNAQDLIVVQETDIKKLTSKLDILKTTSSATENNLRVEIRTSEDILSEKTAEIRSLKMQLSSLQSSLSSTENSLKSELRNLKIDLANRDSELHTVKVQYSTLQASYSVKEQHMNEELKVAQDELIQKDFDIRQLRDRIQETSKELTVLKSENVTLLTHINDLKQGTEFSTESKEISHENIKKMEQKIISSETLLALVRAELDASKQKLEARERTIANLQTREKELLENFSALEMKYNSTQTECAKAKAEGDVLKNSIASAQEKKQSLDEKLRASETTIAELNSQVESYASESVRSQEKCMALQSSYDILQSETTALKELNSTLISTKIRKEDELEAVREQLQQAQISLSMTSGQVKSREQEISLLKNLSSEKDSIIENLRSQLEETRKRIREIEELMARRQNSGRDMEVKLEEALKLNKQLSERLEEIERKSEEMRAQMRIVAEENNILKNGSNFSEEITKLKSQYEEVLADARRDAADHKQNVSQLQAIVVAREDEIRAIRSKLDGEQGRSKNVRDKLEIANSEIQKISSENILVQAQLSKTTEQLDVMKADLVEQEHKSRDLQAEMDKLQRFISDVVGRSVNLRENKTLEDTLQLLKSFSSAAISEAASKSMENTNLRELLQGREEDVKRLEQEIKQKEIELSKLKEMNEQMEKEFLSLSTEHSKFQFSSNQAVKEIQELFEETKSKLESAELQIAALKSQGEESQRCVESATLLADQLRLENDVLKKNGAMIQNAKESDHLNEVILSLQLQNTDLQEKIEVLEQKIAANDDYSNSVNELLKESEAKSFRLLSKNKELAIELRNAIGEISSISLPKRNSSMRFDQTYSPDSATDNDDPFNLLKTLNRSLIQLKAQYIKLQRDSMKSAELISHLESDLSESQNRITLIQSKLEFAEDSADKANSEVQQLQEQVRNAIEASGFGGKIGSISSDLMEQLAILKRVSAAAQSFAASQRMENLNLLQNAGDKETQINELLQSNSTANAQINRLKLQISELEENFGSIMQKYSQLRNELIQLIPVIDSNDVLYNSFDPQSLVAAVKTALVCTIPEVNNSETCALEEELNATISQLDITNQNLASKQIEIKELNEKINLLEKNNSTVGQIVQLLKNENKILKESNARITKESANLKERAEIAKRVAYAAQSAAAADIFSNTTIDFSSASASALKQQLQRKDTELLKVNEALHVTKNEITHLQTVVDDLEKELLDIKSKVSREKEFEEILKDAQLRNENMEEQISSLRSQLAEAERCSKSATELAEALRNEKYMLESGITDTIATRNIEIFETNIEAVTYENTELVDMRVKELEEQLIASESHAKALKEVSEQSTKSLAEANAKIEDISNELCKIAAELQSSGIFYRQSSGLDTPGLDLSSLLSAILRGVAQAKNRTEKMQRENLFSKDLISKLEYEIAESTSRLNFINSKLETAEKSADVANATVNRLQSEIQAILQDSGFMQTSSDIISDTVNQLSLLKRVSKAAQSFAATQRMENISLIQTTTEKDTTIRILNEQVAVAESKNQRLSEQIAELEENATKNISLYSKLVSKVMQILPCNDVENDPDAIIAKLEELVKKATSIENSNESELSQAKLSLEEAVSSLTLKQEQIKFLSDRINLLEKNIAAITQINDLLKKENVVLKESNQRLLKSESQLKERADIATRVAKAAQSAAASQIMSSRKLDGNEMPNDPLQKEIEIAQNGMSAYREELMKLQAEHSKLSSEFTAKSLEIEDLKDKLAKIMDERDKQSASILAMRHAVNTATVVAVQEASIRARQERENEKLQMAANQINDLKVRLAQKESVIKELSGQFLELQKRLAGRKEKPDEDSDLKSLKEQMKRLQKVANAAQQKYAVVAQENLMLNLEIENLKDGLESLRRSCETAWSENNSIRDENKALRERQRALEHHRNETVRELTERVENAEKSAKSAADAATALREQNKELLSTFEQDIGKTGKKHEKIIAKLKADVDALTKVGEVKQQEIVRLTVTLNEFAVAKRKLDQGAVDLREENKGLNEKLMGIAKESASLKEALSAITRPKSALEGRTKSLKSNDTLTRSETLRSS